MVKLYYIFHTEFTFKCGVTVSLELQTKKKKEKEKYKQTKKEQLNI